MVTPVKLAPAAAWRTYQGGSLIAALHGKNEPDTHFPEEWLLSTVAARNPGRENIVEGLSCFAGSEQTLRDYIAADPEKVLGRGRKETGMLMKLIDAAERLSVQVHPTRADAQRLFNSQFGKTECWHILGGREVNGEKPCIYFGFRDFVTKEKWAELFFAQDIQGMLDCLHKIEVKPGETYLIKGGVPHAIGAGCFLAEIQEPTDLTLRTERTSPNGDKLPDMSCHQGVGFEKMLECFDYNGCALEEAYRRWRIPAREIEAKAGEYTRLSVLPYDDTPFFRLEKDLVQGSMTVSTQDSYHGFYCLEGQGQMITDGKIEVIAQGDQYFVPACAAPYIIKAEKPMTLLRYEGPQM